MSKHVVIIGGGFAGVHTLLRLKKQIRAGKVHVTLINKTHYHAFLPMLHEVATAGVDPYHVIKPIALLNRSVPFEFIQGTVSGIDPQARTVQLCDNCKACPNLPHCFITKYREHYDLKTLINVRKRSLQYDYLVVAPGAEPADYGIPGVSHAFNFGSIKNAIAIRDHVFEIFDVIAYITDPAVRKRLLTFVVVGAGPTGVELVTELHDLIHHTLAPQHKHLDFAKDIQIHLINAADRPLEGSADRLREFAQKKLDAMEVYVHNNAPVTRVEKNGVEAEGLGFVDSKTVIWVAGVKANRLISNLPCEKDNWRRAKVLPDLSLKEHPELFVLGDSADVLPPGEKRPLPPTAQVAIQQARSTARNIAADLRSKPRRPFGFHFLGQMVSLGSYYAGANLFGKVEFKGRLAWILWKITYLKHLLVIQPFMRTVLDWLGDLSYDREAMRRKIL